VETVRKLQLDSLRAIAVFAVIITHTWLAGSTYGHLAVRFFFVLSGFLITRHLLGSFSDGRQTPGSALRAFYVRRSFRIMPAYYALLLIMFFLEADGWRDQWYWHAFYGTNVLFTKTDSWSPWFFSHLWSLSVEQQFYLAWPLVVMLLGRKFLAPACFLGIAIAVGVRIVISLKMPGTTVIYWTMPTSSWDALAVGGLLALAPAVKELSIFKWRAMIPVYAGVILLYWLLEYPSSPFAAALWYELIEVLPLLIFAHLVFLGYHDALPRFLNWRILTQLGLISYGIYLYHELAIDLFQRVAGPQYYPSLIQFAGASVISVVLAAISWVLLERPAQQVGRQLSSRSRPETIRSSDLRFRRK